MSQASRSAHSGRRAAGFRCDKRRGGRRWPRYLCTISLIWLATWQVVVGEGRADDEIPPARLPAISIIIDDLGYRRFEGLRAIELPGAVAYAILPHTPYGQRLASIAFQLDKEVLLHLPMASTTEKDLGPGGLTRNLQPEAYAGVLEDAMTSVPNAVGVSNHMGSYLTEEIASMRRLMSWIRARDGLYFVDSITTPRSVALRSAREAGVRTIARDVFLDSSQDPELIRRQFDRLVAMARKHGTALGIGHPYPETLGVLRETLLRPSYFGVELVSVSELIARRDETTRVRAGRTVPTSWEPSGNLPQLQ